MNKGVKLSANLQAGPGIEIIEENNGYIIRQKAVTDGLAAGPGEVGELIVNQRHPHTVVPVNDNIMSFIDLTPGEWDINGAFQWSIDGGTISLGTANMYLAVTGQSAAEGYFASCGLTGTALPAGFWGYINNMVVLMSNAARVNLRTVNTPFTTTGTPFLRIAWRVTARRVR
jgi:hypothetical protein